MGLTLANFYIPEKPYLTKRLEHGTLSKMLDSSPFVVNGIYMLTNDVDQKVNIFEEEYVGPYKISGYVKINWAYAGPARAQVANIKPFRQFIRKRPSYDLRISLTGIDHKTVYSFDQRFTRINQLMDMIYLQTEALNQYITAQNLETK